MNAAAVAARARRAWAVAAGMAVLLAMAGEGLARPKHVKRAKRRAPTASSDADGRSHLKKANALASHGDCKAAVDEYTQAFDRLNDPEVLLARAECFRRLGQADEAVGDYRAYLDESPDVKNRSEIEGKIAALEGAPASKEKPRAESATPSAAPMAPLPASPPPVPKVVAVPEPPRAPGATTSPASPPAVVEIEVGQTPSGATTPAPAPAADERSRRLWLWGAIAVVLVGGAAAGGYFYFRSSDPTVTGTLGSYRF